jgi:hypothetical protein
MTWRTRAAGRARRPVRRHETPQRIEVLLAILVGSSASRWPPSGRAGAGDERAVAWENVDSRWTRGPSFANPHPFSGVQSSQINLWSQVVGGEEGIRTLDTALDRITV